MRALPMTGKPGFPWRNLAMVLILIGLLIITTGCESRQYQAVPECEIAPPPDASRFVDAGVDERLVLMSSSYIDASKKAAECNNRIRLINSSNKALDKLDR